MSPRDALAAFGIQRLGDLPAAYLSAGQKRRVALARLLLAPRPVWLLDEPLIALDVAAQSTLTAIMAAHVAAGGAIVVASHQQLALSYREIALGAAGGA
jgi:heme exporter protein A